MNKSRILQKYTNPEDKILATIIVCSDIAILLADLLTSLTRFRKSQILIDTTKNITLHNIK